MRALYQVDVFTAEPYRGNPVAVVLDGAGLSTEEMQRFAHWMNLSETTFVLPPSDAAADYQVRIFTPVAELPFAGHPTLGTCHAWLEAGGAPRQAGTVVQQCRAGLVTLRQTGDGLAFAAPPVLRDGPVAEELLGRIASVLGIDRADIVDASWADNGPGWVAVLLASAEAVLAVKPATVGPGSRPGRPVPPGIATGVRGPGVLPQGRGHHGGPGDRQPERLPRALAAAHRPGPGSVRGKPGHGPGPRGPGARLPR